jgi:hypothetical protein
MFVEAVLWIARTGAPTSFDVLMAGIICLAFIGDKAFDAIRLRKYLAGRGSAREPPDTLRMTRKNTSGANSLKTSSARSRCFDAWRHAMKKPINASPP